MNQLPLIAETRVALSGASEVMTHLRDHFGEHGEVSGDEGWWTVAFDIGRASAQLDGQAIRFRVEAGDDSSLSFLQWSVAEHVGEFAAQQLPDIAWRGGVAAGAALPYFREMTVLRAVTVTPRLRRLTLAGHNLGRFSHDGIHIRLLLAPAPGVTPVWPVMAADGRQAWPAGPRPVARVYTIRRIDVAAGEIDVDFVLHEGEGMPGADFGRFARPGDKVAMTGPGGANLRPAARYVFLGDETALPAIARLLQELPVNANADVFLEVADTDEIQSLREREGVRVTWLSRAGAVAGTTALLPDALRTAAIDPGDEGLYVWAACEHDAAREIRAHLKGMGLPKRQTLVAAYWRRGEAGEVDG